MASSTVFTVTTASLNSSYLIIPSPQGEIPTPFHAVVVVLLSIISAVGIIGNLFIIGSICLYKRLRVRGHAFIVNLALADLLIVAYIMPVGLATSQFMVLPFSQMMCDVNAFIIATSCGVSTQTLMLIALERYFHICKMHLYRKGFTPRLISFYIFITWIYTAAWTCQGWTGWTQYSYGKHVFLCIFNGNVSFSYNICLSFFGILLPMIVVSVCYYKIFRKVVHSRRAISAHRKKAMKKQPSSAAERLHKPEAEKQAEREYRLIITLFTIVIVFCCCWLPACIVIVLSGLFPGMPKIINKLCMWLAMSNSAVNSIVYGLLNHLFRKGYRIVFERVFCCGHMPKACCTTTKKPKRPDNKNFYRISMWLATCNSAMNSFIHGILNKNFKRGYKQLLQHILCCMVFKRHGKCRQCHGLLEVKDSSSESHDRTIKTKHPKSSVSPSSQSDSSNARSGASTDTKDITIADSQQNLSPIQSTLTLASKPTLRPIQYMEEPESGTQINKQNGTHMTTHDRSASKADRMSIVHVQVTPLTLSGSFFNGGGANSPSQAGSQSSLIHRSLAGSEIGSVDNGTFTDPYHPNSATASAQQNQGQRINRTHPPPSAARPRPTSAQREISMSNVVLETKL